MSIVERIGLLRKHSKMPFRTFTDASAYLSNPTSENCNAFKDAAYDFIDVLESFRSCAVDQGLLDEWEQNFDNARDSLEDFEC